MQLEFEKIREICGEDANLRTLAGRYDSDADSKLNLSVTLAVWWATEGKSEDRVPFEALRKIAKGTVLEKRLETVLKIAAADDFQLAKWMEASPVAIRCTALRTL